MLTRWLALGSLVVTLGGAVGCTIITTTDNNAATPRPRPRPRRPHHQRPRPPSPVPAMTRVAVHHGAQELPPQPPKEEPPRSPTRPSTMARGAAEGRPAGFTPQAAPAYWIWQGPRGGWRLRTTTKNAQHTFIGRITPLDTVISSVSPTRTELRDRVWKSGDAWVFAFTTAGHADGFTFTTRDNGCVEFDLQIDGGKQIVVGKGQVSPPTNHFIVCPHGKTAPVPRRRAVQAP